MKIPGKDYVKNHWFSTSLLVGLGVLGLHNYQEDHTDTRNKVQRAAEGVSTDVVDDIFGIFGKEISFNIDEDDANTKSDATDVNLPATTQAIVYFAADRNPVVYLTPYES